MKAEYTSLRGEIERRSTVQQALFVLNVTAVAVIANLVLKAGLHNSDRSFFLTLLIPYLSFALSRLWLDHDKAIAGLGAYISEHIEASSSIGWETSSRVRARWDGPADRYGFFGAYGIVFLGPSVVALTATWNLQTTDSRQVFWWISLVAAAANLAGWIAACLPKDGQPVSLSRVRIIFEPRVGERLDWDRLAGYESLRINEFLVDEREDFGSWFFAWSVAEHGDGSQESSGSATLLPVTAAGKLDSQREAHIASLEAAFVQAPRRFEICAYRLSRTSRVVVAGNHRLAAALRSGHGFTAHVFEIVGPLEPDLLPHLAQRAPGPTHTPKM